VLRSYSDAYEWDVPDGDVVAAITTTKPRITPLPGEPQGESIAYGPGGTAYYTVSDQENQPVRARVLRYPAPAAAAATAAATATPGPPAAGRPTKVSALGAALIAAITGGVILVGLAMWGALRVGRRPSGAPPP
jgi:hypothetical protein